MEKIYYAIKMKNGKFAQFLQVGDRDIDVFTHDEIGYATLDSKEIIENKFYDLKKDEKDREWDYYSYGDSLEPYEIVKVTITY